MSKIPNDLLYTREHEWVAVKDGVATVGITDHAQDELGDITFVELPSVGATVAQNGEAGAVESVKASSPVYAPLGGIVAAVNQTLDDNPGAVNSDPYGAGWLFKVSVANVAETQNLLSAEKYREFLPAEKDN
ncbi:glycine cleavage system H protein [Planctomycetales bacterium]|nr:glycine cleavage system H protein [Planctomycetales bacterium]GHT03554.1 glycine cleavage system H protein [Planctomycetales bacterium]GHV19749.1 glycine cleavage system H protein [Planctomycetales bacterium]